MTRRKHQDELPGEDDVSGILAQDKHTQPRTKLDAAILAAAKQAVQGKSAGGTSPTSKWAIPVSLAATIVLSVSIVMLMQVPTVPESEPELITEEVTPKVAITPSPAVSDAPLKSPAATPLPSRREARQDETDTLRKRSRLDQESQPRESLASTAVTEEQAEPAFQENATGVVMLETPSEPRLSPEAWLDKIGALLEKNERVKARDELVRMHQAYPDFQSHTMLSLAKQLEIDLNDPK